MVSHFNQFSKVSCMCGLHVVRVALYIHMYMHMYLQLLSATRTQGVNRGYEFGAGGMDLFIARCCGHIAMWRPLYTSGL